MLLKLYGFQFFFTKMMDYNTKGEKDYEKRRVGIVCSEYCNTYKRY